MLQDRAKKAASVWTPASAVIKFNQRKANAALLNTPDSIQYMWEQFSGELAQNTFSKFLGKVKA